MTVECQSAGDREKECMRGQGRPAVVEASKSSRQKSTGRSSMAATRETVCVIPDREGLGAEGYVVPARVPAQVSSFELVCDS